MPFGSGLGTFQPVYQQFEPTSLLSTIYLNQAHNEPMQLAIEGGLPAIFLLLSFLGWWLQAVVQTTGQKTSVSRRALGTAMVVGSLILLLSSLVDYPLRTPLLSSFFAIACVELLRSRRRPEDHKQ
jgi:O-antigen ligase